MKNNKKESKRQTAQQSNQDTTKWNMTYYGQWACYGAAYPIPLTSDQYASITHFAYGFMGYNPAGDIGTWDTWADFENNYTGSNSYAYAYDFIASLWGSNSSTAPSGAPSAATSFCGGGLNCRDPDNISLNDDLSKLITEDKGNLQMYRMAHAKAKGDFKTIMAFGGWQYGQAQNLKRFNTKYDETWGKGQSPARVFYNIASQPTILSTFISHISAIINFTKFKLLTVDGIEYPIISSTPDPATWAKAIPNTGLDSYPSSAVSQEYSLFDGVDIDWEYPQGCGGCENCADATKGCTGSWTPDNAKTSYGYYADLLTKLKAALPNALITTTIIGSPQKIANLSTWSTNDNIKNAFNAIDRVSIMSYDMMIGEKYAVCDSALTSQQVQNEDGTLVEFNAEAAANALSNIGLHKNQINIGAPFYGHFQYIKQTDMESLLNGLTLADAIDTDAFTNKLFNSSTPAVYDSCVAPNEVCPWVNSKTMALNSVDYNDVNTDLPYFYEGIYKDAQVSYYISKEAISYNSDQYYILLSMPSVYSVGNKGTYVKDNGLGGVISWMMPSDKSGVLIKEIYSKMNQT